MSNGDGEVGQDIAGLSTEAAVETVVDADDSLDPSTVRAALEHVAEDDVVNPDAAEASLAETAKVVSTPETRVELAAIALDDAREAAEGVDDLGAVRSRLSSFESRLSAIDDRVTTLGSDLQTLTERDLEEAALFPVGREIQRIRYEATELQRAADDLQFDCEDFETWLDDPSVRADELATDVEAVAESLSGLAETLDAVESLEGDADDSTDGQIEVEDPGETWAEASVTHRVTGLLLADLRTELADLRTVAERTDSADDADLDEVDARIEDLAERRDATGERVDALGRPARRERHADRLAAVDDALASFEPPVAWGDVQAALDRAQR